jgi:hypothetical protein
MWLPERMKFGIFLGLFHRVGENPTPALDCDLEPGSSAPPRTASPASKAWRNGVAGFYASRASPSACRRRGV